MTQSAAAAEALGNKIPFHSRGVDFALDPTSEWSFDALEAFDDGRLSHFLRIILGEKQYAAFKATKPKVTEVNEFIEELQKALGIEGN